MLVTSMCESDRRSVGQGFSREINYQLFSLVSVYIYCETEYVRVFVM